jgi:hypothetical protein
MGLKLAKCRLVRTTALLGFVKSHFVNIDYVWIVLLHSEGNITKLTIKGTSANGAKQWVWGGGADGRGQEEIVKAFLINSVGQSLRALPTVQTDRKLSMTSLWVQQNTDIRTEAFNSLLNKVVTLCTVSCNVQTLCSSHIRRTYAFLYDSHKNGDYFLEHD